MIGRTVLHYQIVETLGHGGMGVVYKARDTHLDRFVAIKVLPPEKVADPERKRRFAQEAALAIGEFRRCGFAANAPGPATRLTVTVKTPATSHEVRISKIEAWPQSGGRSPNEQAMKVRLRELLGG
jgi:serine/threonine protein kinase